MGAKTIRHRLAKEYVGYLQRRGCVGANAGIYTIDKKRKVLVRTMPGTDEETHERIIIVLKKLGWTMEDKCKTASG
jgi:hypothetical protein